MSLESILGYVSGLKMKSLKRHFTDGSFPLFMALLLAPLEKLIVIVSQGAVENEENFHLMFVPSSGFLWESECARTCMVLHFLLGYIMILYPMKANLRDRLECPSAMHLKGL